MDDPPPNTVGESIALVAPPPVLVVTNAATARTTVPPQAVVTIGLALPQGSVDKTTASAHGPMAMITLQPHSLTIGFEDFHRSTTAIHGGTSRHNCSVSAVSHGSILEQVLSFPPFPPRFMCAPTHSFNETLAYVQLGSTQFSRPDP